MHRRHKYDIVAILAVFGLSVSLYLAVTKALGVTVPCGVTKGCTTVLDSQYSILLGIPLPWYGIAFFIAALVSALLANHYAIWRKVLTWVLGAGALASFSFLAIQLFVLKSICQWCLMTDLAAIAMFVWDLNIDSRNDQFPQDAK